MCLLNLIVTAYPPSSEYLCPKAKMSEALPLPSHTTTGTGGVSLRYSSTMEITLGPPSTIRATTGTPWPIPAHKYRQGAGETGGERVIREKKRERNNTEKRIEMWERKREVTKRKKVCYISDAWSINRKTQFKFAQGANVTAVMSPDSIVRTLYAF